MREVAPLAAKWSALARDPSRDGFAAAARALAEEVVHARSALFDANATLQITHPDDDPAMIAAVDANQDQIKQCTVILGEMRAALGITSLPA